LSAQEDEYQRGLIITDDIAIKPILDFDRYSDAIVKIVKESYPKFTIGLFGEWGTGKTTLMNSIKKELEKDKENIITVWFDAWKYENEKEFALIPLIKTINYSITGENDEKKKNLREALKEAAIFTLGTSSDILSSIVSNYTGKELGGLFKKSLDDVTSKLIPQLKSLKELSEADKNSIFYR
jgi:tRNA A37 threonylcarbamoyladenosine biosynthesis protein TsaE